MIVGFSFPILASTWLIVSGATLSKTIYWTGLERYSGVYLKIHTLAHSMYVFLFLFFLYLNYFFDKDERLSGSVVRKFLRLFLIILAICALYNLYKSYTRTVFIGIGILICFYLIGSKRYKLLLAVLVSLLFVALFSKSVHTIFWDVVGPLTGNMDIQKMGSGRVSIWLRVKDSFMAAPFERIFIGFGLGKSAEGSDSFFASFHSDLVGILVSLGIIGLLLYISFYSRLFYDILTRGRDRFLITLYIGFLISTLTMNGISNSYLSRFELGQYFFFFMGIFYTLCDTESEAALTHA
jgi:O-antigen ligase